MLFQFDFPFPTCSLHCLLRLFSDKRNGRHGPRASQMFLTRSLSPGALTIPVPLDFSISTFTQVFSLAQHWTHLFLSNQIFQKIKNSLINQSSLQKIYKIKKENSRNFFQIFYRKTFQILTIYRKRLESLLILYRTKIFEYFSKDSLLKH